MRRLAILAVIAIVLWPGAAWASGSGSTSGLACSASGNIVTVTGMRTSDHVLYEAKLSDGSTDLAPWPPPTSYGFYFPDSGTFTVSVIIEKGEGNLKGGPGGWTFYGVTTVPNVCEVTLP